MVGLRLTATQTHKHWLLEEEMWREMIHKYYSGVLSR
jgi:hypothetical protein